jgi:hypothetical protein
MNKYVLKTSLVWILILAAIAGYGLTALMRSSNQRQ